MIENSMELADENNACLGGEEAEDEVEDEDDDDTQSFDLNNMPLDPLDKMVEAAEDQVWREKARISKIKERKDCKANNSKSAPISLKLKDVWIANGQKRHKKIVGRQSGQLSRENSVNSENSNSISVEIIKTKNNGMEVGFQLDGFDEALRCEIEGEGVAGKEK
ncbi:hypothetical protein L2E82_34797 [Cichorium intybus]|uniref:Uncharacterized protein n=1 Tax=Cichorium intybus TaxID=13427 RepID=A0ACB9BMU8_CICIN|nr:hypothetical protein L2E82_34797 [Cichorium intybus]